MLAFLANSLHSLAEKFDEYNELLSNSINPNEELDSSRYQLLYILTLAQNKQQQKVFVKENTALFTKYQKSVEDLETANIIIKTQGHTIQEKNRLIEDMEARLRDREDKIRKQIEEKAQLRLRLNEARNDCNELKTEINNTKIKHEAELNDVKVKQDDEKEFLQKEIKRLKNQIDLKVYEHSDTTSRLNHQVAKTNYWMEECERLKQRVTELEQLPKYGTQVSHIAGNHLSTPEYWKTLYENLDDYWKQELPKINKKIDDLTTELAIYKTVYSDIMILPEGTKCPWEDADIISAHYYIINNKRYILWGKGLLRCTNCNIQQHGRNYDV